MLPGPGRGTFKRFVNCILLTKTYGGQFSACDPFFCPPNWFLGEGTISLSSFCGPPNCGYIFFCYFIDLFNKELCLPQNRWTCPNKKVITRILGDCDHFPATSQF
jgi:hypothetical protein